MYEGEVVKRFSAIYEDPIVDLKILKQEGSIQQYQEAFETLLNRVELNEAYAVSLFIGGLKKEVSMPIRMFKITNLTDVYVMAKMQEATNAVLKPMYNSSLLSTPKFVPNSVNKYVNAPLKSATVNGGNQIMSRNSGNRLYRLTQKELEEKRAKNQCFYYDQKYFVGHKYSGRLYSLEVVSENDNELVIEVEDEAFKDCVKEVITIESSPQISLNALSGLNSFQTMRVKGMFGKHTLHILVDCGSTHSLLDLKIAKNLGYKFDNTTPLQVSVANGQNMMSCYECKNFQWSLQGETFTSDVMFLPLGGCEIVLGIQWLATLGDIQCNFQNLTMKFEYNGRRMVLRGTKNTTIH
ncbi:retrovirus-related pol polyprotein from transposon 17.6 [Tanacetum coccineum]